MRNKNFIIVLTVIISLLCVFMLSFTYVARKEQRKAVEYATGPDGQVDLSKKQDYFDKIYDSTVYNFLGLKYTYKEVKETELALGLDLQGGMHVTLEVSPVEILTALAGSNSSDPSFQKALQNAKIKQKTSTENLTSLFYDSYREIEGKDKLKKVFANSSNRNRGIDLRSDDQAVEKMINEEVESAIDRAEEILRTRIDKFGAVQPNIQRLRNSSRIQVELPGVENPQRVKNLLQGAAKLEFLEVYNTYEIAGALTQVNNYLLTVEKPVSGKGKSLDKASAEDLLAVDSTGAADTTVAAAAPDSNTVAKVDSAKADTSAPKASSLFALLKAPNTLRYDAKDTGTINNIFENPKVKAMLPSNLKLFWDKKAYKGTDGTETLELVPVKKSRTGTTLTGEVIVDARGDVGQDGKNFEVSMQMNAVGAKKWKKMTADASSDPRNKRRIAIVLDDYVYSAPVVNGEIPNGNSSISGNFTFEEAKDLANILKAGKLPAPVRIVEEVIVGPTLGKEAIQQGLYSMLGGVLVVVLFMIFYYSKGGMVADIALLFNILFILGVMASLPTGAVLTLPGIAGIVLTIGMSVDANVLIFERVREELANGKSVFQAIELGYEKAFSSIFDSNVTTLLVGVILYIFGSGPVKGFAITLIIGIICSFFTAV
ncbi:MAG TPA: protein translocase subunit SecD, partial [Cytophagaceae bacterium]